MRIDELGKTFTKLYKSRFPYKRWSLATIIKSSLSFYTHTNKQRKIYLCWERRGRKVFVKQLNLAEYGLTSSLRSPSTAGTSALRNISSFVDGNFAMWFGSLSVFVHTHMHTTNEWIHIRVRHTPNINYLRHMPFIINYILLWHSIVFTSISPCSTLR